MLNLQVVDSQGTTAELALTTLDYRRAV